MPWFRVLPTEPKQVAWAAPDRGWVLSTRSPCHTSLPSLPRATTFIRAQQALSSSPRFCCLCPPLPPPLPQCKLSRHAPASCSPSCIGNQDQDTASTTNPADTAHPLAPLGANNRVLKTGTNPQPASPFGTNTTKGMRTSATQAHGQTLQCIISCLPAGIDAPSLAVLRKRQRGPHEQVVGQPYVRAWLHVRGECGCIGVVAIWCVLVCAGLMRTY